MKFIALIATAAAIRLSAGPKGLTKEGLGEFKELMADAFVKCDKDNSATLSVDEGKACLKGAGVPKKYWKQIGDALKPYAVDGELPATAGEQMSKDLDALFDHVDANDDEKISWRDFKLSNLMDTFIQVSSESDINVVR